MRCKLLQRAAILCAAPVCLGAILISASGAEPHQASSNRPMTESFSEIRDDDVDALRAWARDLCHGSDVSSLARALKVAPEMQALLDVLTSHLPAESRAAIEEVCRRELVGAKDENSGAPPSS